MSSVGNSYRRSGRKRAKVSYAELDENGLSNAKHEALPEPSNSFEEPMNPEYIDEFTPFSRLDVQVMSAEEKEAFPYASANPDIHRQYLAIRNTLLQMWDSNCHEELTLSKALSNPSMTIFLEAHEQLVRDVHRYLSKHGHINFGVFREMVRPPLQGGRPKRILVIGAGMAGLIAARHLSSFGYSVLLLEARDRAGGRIHSIHDNQHVADLGAMVITGLGGNPLATLCKQLGPELYPLRQVCPLYDESGHLINRPLDLALEEEFNLLLATTKHISQNLKVQSKNGRPLALGDALELAMADREYKRMNEQIKKLDVLHPAASKLCSLTEDIIAKQETLSRLASHLAEIPPAHHPRVYSQCANRKNELHVCSEQCSHHFGELPGESFEAVEDQPPITLSWTTQRLSVEAARAAAHDLTQQIQALVYDIRLLMTQQREIENFLFSERDALSEKYLTPSSKSVVDWHIANLEFANATTLDTLSLQHWDQDDQFEFTGSHLTVREGYGSIVNGLIVGLDIAYQHVVKSVRYSPKNVSVESLDKNGNKVVHEGDALLVTLPLGVLKEQAVTFSPSLPKWKTDAIGRLGFGLLNKVILFFSNVFWDCSTDMFGWCSNESAVRGEFFLFWNFEPSTSRPTLVVLSAGVAAREQEEKSDEEIVSKVMSVLRSIYGVKTIDPISSKVTRWFKDPFARGSYSYIAVGSTGQDYEILAQPVAFERAAPTLYFGGEHTCRNYPATVHGALISGLREAARIIDNIPNVSSSLI